MPGSRLSRDSESASTLVLDLPASRIVSDKYLLLKPPNLWHFVRAAQTEEDRQEVVCFVLFAFVEGNCWVKGLLFSFVWFGLCGGECNVCDLHKAEETSCLDLWWSSYLKRLSHIHASTTWWRNQHPFLSHAVQSPTWPTLFPREALVETPAEKCFTYESWNG